MTTLLEKALEKVGALPQDEQDAIASQILDSLADEEAWKRRFAGKRERLRQLARGALDEGSRGEARPLEGLLWIESKTAKRFWEAFALPDSVQQAARTQVHRSDLHSGRSRVSGHARPDDPLIGFQLHTGPPMKVEYRNLWLKKL